MYLKGWDGRVSLLSQNNHLKKVTITLNINNIIILVRREARINSCNRLFNTIPPTWRIVNLIEGSEKC